jgi:alpha-1,3-rhamnosyl/mannosyltransferase
MELVALGGPPSAVPPLLVHVGESWHPGTNLGWTTIGVPRAARRARVDLIHAPAYTAPLWAPVPVVLTIHDVSYERRPEWYPYRHDRLRRAFYRRSARAASHVVTDSEFSKAEIIAAYGIAAERITVAPLGVSEIFGPEGSSRRPLPDGVTRPFLLHVGDLHERRNVAVIIRALLHVRRRLGTAPALVLAGVDRGAGRSLSAIADEAGGLVLVRVGAVDDEELRGLYGAADALVYPSRYEGFGLPVLEAMASGVPVIASREASLPEVVGSAGLLLDPDDEAEWAEAIMRVREDAAYRSQLVAAGRARAAEFTWARTARITFGVYTQVLARAR